MSVVATFADYVNDGIDSGDWTGENLHNAEKGLILDGIGQALGSGGEALEKLTNSFRDAGSVRVAFAGGAVASLSSVTRGTFGAALRIAGKLSQNFVSSLNRFAGFGFANLTCTNPTNPC